MRYTKSKRINIKNNVVKALTIIIILIILVLCFIVGNKMENIGEETGLVSEDDFDWNNLSYLEVTDYDRNTQVGQAELIDLNQLSGMVTISTGGEYRLSGELEGTLVVDAKDEKVHLFLDNVIISSDNGPAIFVKKSDKTVITSLPDTINILSDSTYYDDFEFDEACLCARSELVINGEGKLVITGYREDAVRSKDIVKLIDSNCKIKCKGNAIHGSDGVVIEGGNVDLSAEKKGIRTTRGGEDGRGDIVLSDTNISIICGKYAFETMSGDYYEMGTTLSIKSVIGTYNVNGIIVGGSAE